MIMFPQSDALQQTCVFSPDVIVRCRDVEAFWVFFFSFICTAAAFIPDSQTQPEVLFGAKQTGNQSALYPAGRGTEGR